MAHSSDAPSEGVSALRETPRLADDAPALARKLADCTHELAQSEARFRAIIEQNGDALVVVDDTGVVRFANRAAAILFGKRREDLVGVPFGFPVVAEENTGL